ncbi:MAG: sugar ABC transporter ATP-binding protein [Clostridia bacterium]
MSDYILELKGISKRFPGVKALDRITFSVERGTVHALVGENGAGKSTLIKILAGIYRAEEGEVLLNGRPVLFKSPFESQLGGVSVVHQELKLSETLTVAENVFLGKLLYRGGLVDWKAMRARADTLLRQLGLAIDVNEVVANLSVAQKQMVEICKAINRNCQVLIMDEPSATLTEKEQKIMFRTVKMLREQGVTVIYISHRLEEIFDLADNVTILRDGLHIKTLPVADVTRHDLVAMMVGREVSNEYPKSCLPLGDVVLEVKDIFRPGVLDHVSFTLHKGEILGVAGLVGAGRTELVRAILGIDKIKSGQILLKGHPIKITRFRQAIVLGFGLVPEDRKKQGLVQMATVLDNICMVSMDKVSKGNIMNRALERKYTEEYIEKMSISTPSIDTEVQYLSGGNQQKVVIAKWLLQDSEIIILDEPTRGIDVGAKREIYLLVDALVKQGKSVIMISSELPEVVGMSDRVLVMHEGRKAGELKREELSQERIMALCV